MATPTSPSRFDPLVEFKGRWTTELAERYLPIEGMPPAKYECVGGNLIVSPREGFGNGYAAGELYSILRVPMRRAGHLASLPGNMRINGEGWIEPDVIVLRQPIGDATWAPAEMVLMPVEVVSRSSVRRDKVDKPALCAALGIPYYMWADVRNGQVHVELLRLNDAGSYVLHAKADLGEVFRANLPVPFSFETGQLVVPR